MEQPTQMQAERCFHIVYHPATREEFEAVVAQLEYARTVGDVAAFPLLMEQLTGACEHRYTPQR